MPTEFAVELRVSMHVWADHQKDAQALGQGWLQEALNAATAGNGISGGISRSFVTAAENVVEDARPLFDYEAKERAEQEFVRRTPGRAELLDQLQSAVTTEDYLAAQGTVQQWLTSHPEPYHTALSSLIHRLDTFAEAMRWAESHPSGPYVWNVAALLTAIKAEIQKEVEATRTSGD